MFWWPEEEGGLSAANFAVLSATIGTLMAAGLGNALAQASSVNGEVTKIDKEQSKITLKHGPIKNLDMDGMTMVFRVQGPKMLGSLKTGDKVKFEADRVNGQVTIIKMQKSR